MRLESPPSALCAAAEAKRFFDFVDPEDDRRHHFRLAEGFAQPPFGFADVFVIQGADIHPQQRPMPGRGDRFCRERFSRALDPEHQDAAQALDAELSGFLAERLFSLFEPELEPAQAADFVHANGRLHVLEQSIAGDEPPLLGEHRVEIFCVEAMILADCVANHLPRLARAQSAQIANDRVILGGGEIHMNRRLAPHARTVSVTIFLSSASPGSDKSSGVAIARTAGGSSDA